MCPKVDKSQLMQKFAKGFICVTLFTRSMRNKISLINHYIHYYKVNIAVITEMWIKKDKEWIKESDLNKNGYKF